MAMYVTLTGSSYEGISGRDIEFFDFGWHWKDFAAARNPMPLWTFLLPVAWALIALHLLPMVIQFHYLHRFLHENRALYLYIHKVHHLAVDPIYSDAGTESPIEFGLDEVNVLAFLHPIAYLVVAILNVRPQCSEHDCYFNNVVGTPDCHHYKHHKFVSWNYSIAFWDEISGTSIPTDKHVNLNEYNNGKAE